MVPKASKEQDKEYWLARPHIHIYAPYSVARYPTLTAKKAQASFVISTLPQSSDRRSFIPLDPFMAEGYLPDTR